MAAGRWATILRLLKPVVAGLALAYLVTSFVDKPAPVHFQPENPYAAVQSAIVEPQADMVTEKNIMKLGSPLSVNPDEGFPDENPLAQLESFADSLEDNATSIIFDSSIISGNATSPDEEMNDNATLTVHGVSDGKTEQP